MSAIPLLPHYFVGTRKSHDALATNPTGFDNPGEYHFWTPDWTPGDPKAPAAGPWISPDSLIYVAMKSSNGVPHPDWYPLPHVLDGTPVMKVWKGVAHPAVAKAIAHGLINNQDTCFTAVQKLHQQMKTFLP